MDAQENARGVAGRLGALIAAVVVLAGVISWTAVTAIRDVTERTDALVTEQIPELRAISELQDKLHRRVLSVYLYYTTMDDAYWQTGDAIAAEVETDLNAIGWVEYGLGDSDLALPVTELTRHIDRFHQEMNKGRSRNWDTLREHLAEAQLEDLEALGEQLVGGPA